MSRLGQNIEARRSGMGLSREDLAAAVGVGPETIGAWEVGSGVPDLDQLLPLAKALNMKAEQLLSNDPEPQAAPLAEDETSLADRMEHYSGQITRKRSIKGKDLVFFIISTLFLVAIFVCLVVNLAVERRLNWAWIPILSIVYAWLCLFPVFYFPRHKIRWGLISASVFLLPFLFFLDKATQALGLGISPWFSSLGLYIAICSLIYFWLSYYMFCTKMSIWNKIGFVVLGGAVLNLVVELIVSTRLQGTSIEGWDLISPIATVFVALIFFALARFIRKSS